MSKLTVAAPVPGDRLWLERKTEFILSLAYRQACDIIRIGAELEEVKRTLGHGLYEQWVADEMPFSVQHARKFRLVARSFAAFQSAQFERFEPSALFVLAQVKGVKPEVRAHAVQLAEQGERITHALARELIDAHKPVPDLSRGELKRYDDLKRDIRKQAVLGKDGEVKVNKDGKPVLADLEAEAERQRLRADRESIAVGELLAAAVETFARVEIVVHRDEPLPLRGTGYPADEDADVVSRTSDDVRLLLEEMLDRPRRTKHCNGGCCKTELDEIWIGEFCKNKDQTDGRNPRCKKCERARKAAERVQRRQQGDAE